MKLELNAFGLNKTLVNVNDYGILKINNKDGDL